MSDTTGPTLVIGTWALKAVTWALAAIVESSSVRVGCYILTAEGVVARLGGANGGLKGFGAARQCCCATIIWSALKLFIGRTGRARSIGATYTLYRLGGLWGSSPEDSIS